MEAKPMKAMNAGMTAMALVERCGAKTRQGTSCRCAVRKGRSRCHKHGGAKGSGAPKGKANGAYSHGGWTGEAVELRREVSRLLQATKAEA